MSGKNSTGIDRLLSLPPRSAGLFGKLESARAYGTFVVSDPPGRQLGSGGGTAHLLHQAWRGSRTGLKTSFDAWLAGSRKLLIHGSGEGRRLPCYAPLGKPLMPVPCLKGRRGQSPDQKLLDLQTESYERVFRCAPESYRVMVTCGDVVITFDNPLPVYPEVDVLIVGLPASPEEAQHHGVMICPFDRGGEMVFFLQKPSPAKIKELSSRYMYYLDTGVWMLSERAVLALMGKCGWRKEKEIFRGGTPGRYDLFSNFAMALGGRPSRRDRDVSRLTCAVLPLADGRFYHFGTNRSIVNSVSQMQDTVSEQKSFGDSPAERRVMPVIQNSDVRCVIDKNQNRYVWIENSSIPKSWTLASRNVLTGVPENRWNINLEPGACLDFVPVGRVRTCIRFYGFDDQFRGEVGNRKTIFMGRPVSQWFRARVLTMGPGRTDLQDLKIFPVVKNSEIESGFVEWLFRENPGSGAQADRWRKMYMRSRKISARDLIAESALEITARRRKKRIAGELDKITGSEWEEASPGLDLSAVAGFMRSRVGSDQAWGRRRFGGKSVLGGLAGAHDSMFRSSIWKGVNLAVSVRHEKLAFEKMRNLIIGRVELEPVQPCRNVLDDQIVWGRSPVRLDLAGGWSDTPPYCLEYGGKVVNVAVDLNGQPPIQVFGRIRREREIVLRSVDLGIDEKITAYGDLSGRVGLGSGFGVVKAALALAGFSPEFHARSNYASLSSQLECEMGGGIELSMMCAIPKGSGLGTSSILAATVLGTLSELCGLNWDSGDIFRRTIALEQMLTSGGGWQDQIGGIAGGLKLIETRPGLDQQPTISWLPDGFFSPVYANRQVLLYYTGITRVAYDILGEIVRGLFLNSSRHLSLIDDIGRNAMYAGEVIQQNDWNGLCDAVGRSWQLNQLLDAGTNPPQVRAILERVGDCASASKLLGAGGGGYLLMFARDTDSASRIRDILEKHPPNPRARFVDLSLSEKGFQVTRS